MRIHLLSSRSVRVTLLSVGAYAALGASALAQQPLNLTFERASVAYADSPWGWSLGWSAFVPGAPATFTLDSVVRVEGRRSLRISAADTGSSAPLRMLMLQLPAAFARGRELRLSGAIRTRGLHGSANVHLEAWGDRVVPAGDSIVLRTGPTPDSGWHRLTLVVRVPADSSIHSIVIMTGVRGSGVAWFDDLALDVNGKTLSSLPVEVQPITAEELRWLAARSAPWSTLDPSRPSETSPDLALVDRIVGKARLVGLGESTHGTHEFFLAKHRILAHLVERQDFDVFAIEANQLAVRTLDAYVQGGAGTAQDAMRVMFRVWNTEEMLALVEWMRRYNTSHPQRPVHFIGYDMQDQRTPFDSLEAFARRVEPAWVERVRALAAEYRGQPSYVMPNVAQDRRAMWALRSDSLWREARARRPRWLASATSHDDSLAVEWAVHNADLIRQAARLNVTLNSPDRDSLMAANLDWAMRTLHPASRAVVWAHDVHVSHGGDRARSFNAGAQMGAHLKHTFGYDYRAFTLLTRAGQYSATRSFSDHAIIAADAFPAPEGSAEAMLATMPRPSQNRGIVVDLRVTKQDPHAQWLWQPRAIRHIGYAAYDYGFEMRAVLPLEFDGVVFIDTTTASRMLPVRSKPE